MRNDNQREQLLIMKREESYLTCSELAELHEILKKQEKRLRLKTDLIIKNWTNLVARWWNGN